MGQVDERVFEFQMTDEVVEAGAEILLHELAGEISSHSRPHDLAKRIFTAMASVGVPIRRISDDDLEAFVPTDADVESLAVCLYACMYEHSFATGKRLLLESLPSDMGYSWHRVARAAFDHAGYLPSIFGARQDARNAYRYERGVYAAEIEALKNMCGNLESQLKVSPRERNDAGPGDGLSIDSITRLIQMAHEVGDEDLLKLAAQAAKKLLSLGLTSTDLS